MKVLKAEHFGMCFGVKDAIGIAVERAAIEPVTVLGDLVHNESVLQQLRFKGIVFAQATEAVSSGLVMITAHGASNTAIEQARIRGLRVIEATCPLVHAAHRAVATLVRDGFHPIIVGKKDHVEVRGITEDLTNFDVVLTERDVLELRERPRFGIAAQTTQPIARVRHLVQLTRERFPKSEIRFVDTVCQPTKQRQNAAVELAQCSDVVIVVGGPNSNNTIELAKTCREYCDRIHHIQTAADLRAAWFCPEDTVGITAGTSTPDDVFKAVEDWLVRLTGDSNVQRQHKISFSGTE